MNIEKDAIINLVLMIFPMLVYFVYNCYREMKCEKYNNLLLKVTLVSSIYLSFKYGNIGNNNLVLMFCNLPIVIAYLKREWKFALLLSLMIVVFSYCIFNVSIWVLVIKFICYYVIYFIGNKKRVKDNTFILLIAVLQGFFLSLEYYSSISDDNLQQFVDIVFIILLFYLLPFLLLWLFKLADRVSGLYVTISELEKDKQLRNSLFKITHEVKNPIAVCKGYLDMIEINDIDKTRKYVSIIRDEINRSLDIMNDFMEFSKIKIDKDIIDINLLLEEVSNDMKLLISNNNINFDCRIMSDEVFVMGDYNRLKQVFVNLIKNSFEAIEGSGNIFIVTHVLKDIFYIEISDDGCGMSEEVLRRVKEMFYTTKSCGTGLGVSLSNEIIKAHDGSIEYSSREGKGTNAVVKIPIYVL